jgi:acyl-CoA synthetase (AMP-forming)/AMP-acid ligase II
MMFFNNRKLGMSVKETFYLQNNMVQRLLMHAEQRPSSTAFCFLEKGETEQSRITFAELDMAARRIANSLSGLALQSRVLLLLPSGIEFIQAFMGCLYAGMIAIPAYPPEGGQKRKRLYSIVEDCNPSLLITTRPIREKYQQRADSIMTNVEAGSTKSMWNAIEDLLCTSPASVSALPAIEGDSIAFLQYTSGSTGAPKGVIVTHQNLYSNQEMIASVFKHDENTIFGSWLPLFHDMGLVGNILQPMYLGVPCYFMSPLAFVEKPIRWLNMISRYRITTTGAPNFGFEACIKRVSAAQCATLDLNCWRVAFNGAEIVRAKTIEEFTAKFQPFGFSASAMFPVYGMAEATLLVTGGDVSAAPCIRYANKRHFAANQLVLAKPDTLQSKDESEWLAMVGCGQAAAGQEIKIVDPYSHLECSQGSVGEIWLRGKNISPGYYNHVTADSPVFGQTILNGKSGLAYFRTGDLGAISDGELFLTGRLKDLIIVRGQNHYPHDLEQTISASESMLILDGCAVFSIEDDGVEKVVAVQEVEKSHIRTFNPDEIAGKVRERLQARHGITLDALLWVRPAIIPRTTSGKISRSSCKQKYLNGDLSYHSASHHANFNLVPEREDETC